MIKGFVVIRTFETVCFPGSRASSRSVFAGSTVAADFGARTGPRGAHRGPEEASRLTATTAAPPLRFYQVPWRFGAQSKGQQPAA